MRIKGSRVLRCEDCKRIVGWTVPTGENFRGFNLLDIKLHEGCKRLIAGTRYLYLCEECLQSTTVEYDKESKVMYTYD